MTNCFKIISLFIMGLSVTVIVCCAGSTPPKIENGYYIDTEYGLNIKIPSGWKSVIGETNENTTARNNPDVLIYNKITSALISIASRKIPSITYGTDVSQEHILHVNKEMLTDLNIPKDCDAPEIQQSTSGHFVRYRFICKKKDKLSLIESHSIWYKCQEDSLCQALVTLVSDHRLAENNKALEAITKSISKETPIE